MTDSATRGLEKIWRRLQMAIGLGRVRTGDDGGNVQMLQVELQGSDVRDNTPRVAEYGFTSLPLPGCQAVVLFVAGDRSNGVVIGTNDESNRPTGLAPGEVKVYTDLGQSLYFSRSGTVIDCAGLPMTILNTPLITADTPLLRTTGDVQDNYETNDMTMAEMRAIFNLHTHDENNVAGGPTDVPNQSM